jgi:hypothetical protein
MLDAGVQDVRLFQFILLPGTEASNQDSRERYHYVTGFRALARCFGRYDILGRPAEVAEVQEVCLGTHTMSRSDYIECRAFDLTVALFNNGGVVREFFRLGEVLGVKRSVVLQHIAGRVKASASLRQLNDELREQEARNFFAAQTDLEAFLAEPGTLDRYLAGEFGVNHVYRARTIALTTLFNELARVAHDAVSAALHERGMLEPVLQDYLRELVEVSIVRKSHLTDLQRQTVLDLHFDFVSAHAADYLVDPRDLVLPGGHPFVIGHSDEQRHDLARYFAQYGEGPQGLEQFIQRNDSHLSAVLYRSIDYARPLVRDQAL